MWPFKEKCRGLVQESEKGRMGSFYEWARSPLDFSVSFFYMVSNLKRTVRYPIHAWRQPRNPSIFRERGGPFSGFSFRDREGTGEENTLVKESVGKRRNYKITTFNQNFPVLELLLTPIPRFVIRFWLILWNLEMKLLVRIRRYFPCHSRRRLHNYTPHVLYTYIFMVDLRPHTDKYDSLNRALLQGMHSRGVKSRSSFRGA